MAELSHPKGRCRNEYIEAWTRLAGGGVAALELVSESTAGDSSVSMSRAGYWLFCGDHFVRIVGLPRGQGLVAGTCCASTGQLEAIAGAKTVREELTSRYEAIWGRIEGPGQLRICQQAFAPKSSDLMLLDLSAGIGGSISFGQGEVIHRLANGSVQHWRIRDWGLDPFRKEQPQTLKPSLAAGATSTATTAEAADSDEESSSSSSSSTSPSGPPAGAVPAPAPPAMAAVPAVPAAAPPAAPPVAALPAAPIASAVAAAAPAAGASKSRSSSSSGSSRSASASKSPRPKPKAVEPPPPIEQKRSPGQVRKERDRDRDRDRRRRQDSRDRGRRRHTKDRGRRRRRVSEDPARKDSTKHAPDATALYPYGAFPPQADVRPPGAGPTTPAAYPAYPAPGQGPRPDGRYPPVSGPPPGFPPPRPGMSVPGWPHGPPPGFPPGGPVPGPGGPGPGPGPYGMPPGPPGYMQPPGAWGPVGHRPPGPGAGPPPVTAVAESKAAAGGAGSGAGAAAEEAAMKTFVTENQLDKAVEDRLRQLTPGLRQQVFAGGALSGADRSASAMDRIAAVEKDAGYRGRNGGRGPDHVAKALSTGAKTLPPKAAGAAPTRPVAPQAVGHAWSDPARPPHPHAHPPPHLGAHPPPLGAPPGGWGLPPDPRIDWFCRQYGVDAGAERVLRKLHPEAQRRILDEGPPGQPGSNPSLELISRIHRYEAWEHGHHVAQFLAHGRPSPAAQDSLRALPIESQKRILAMGPLRSSDPSLELLDRVRSEKSNGARGRSSSGSSRGSRHRKRRR
eukprot:TRINITY_DN27919_c0_g1_i1.p1 TRINITY_DN27919_c0_g1~~TRINITY_DN27919_c0_g1_i1.p1  ORF type:complete len:910 (-),score=208.19 TRINITY_DN27919_c0_g1_i1:186-2549(-)